MTKRILLFDDDLPTMAPLKAELEEHGYEVVLSAAQEILELLPRQRFDLICVDVMIHPESPDWDGVGVVINMHYPGITWQKTGQEFLTRLRRGDYDPGDGNGTSHLTPVIVLSATADPKVDYPATTVIEKPFDLAEVLAHVDELLRG